MEYTVYYNSWDTFCKEPFGAVKEGQNVTLNVRVSTDIDAKALALILRNDNEKEGKYFWFSQENANNDFITYKLSFSVEEKGLYFYRFEIITYEDVLFVGRDNKNGAIIGPFLPEWQLTVYSKDYVTPVSLENGVMYQIFPDRFKKGENTILPETKNHRTMHSDWYERPLFIQDDPKYEATDFFGGNFVGITEKLGYLKELGVTLIYFNPIFEASSNHRYNTADYLSPDPYLGTEKDFCNLLKEAKKLGISVILDGVFSHTGSDSIYFNKEGHYDSVGAYQSENSPYASWYKFSKDRTEYESWWGFTTLPNVEESDPNYIDFICGKNGVIAYWMSKGVKGWRLDVADELPDIFIEELRKRVKQEDKDAIVIGEVWEDASNKESYGYRRPYLLGGQLDSVMNYPWRNAILDFIKSGNAENFYKVIMGILDNYPAPTIHTLMNSLSTHDTVRAINELGVENEVFPEHQGDYQLSFEEYARGKHRLVLASVLQYTLPGIPCVYYGDEAGLSGFRDPWNRRCYPWGREDVPLIQHFKNLGEVRKKYADSFTADMKFISANNGVVAFVRGDILTVVNCGGKEVSLSVEGKEILIQSGVCILDGNSVKICPNSAAIIKL